MISIDEHNYSQQKTSFRLIYHTSSYMISSHDSRWFLPHDVDEIAGDEGIRLDILARVYIYILVGG